MKQVVILSGKGGTGKTTVTSMLAYEIWQDDKVHAPIFADADVDASNLALIFSPKRIYPKYFSGGKVAVFNPTNCIGCHQCIQLCRFDAISVLGNNPKNLEIDAISCEGCGLCVLACPSASLSMENVANGEWFQSESRFGPLFHANLYPGQENSGKLVTQVRIAAQEFGEDQQSDILMIDGPPGIGCPVIAAVTGVDLAIIVTEPTLSGLHDLQRMIETVTHFKTKAAVILNKSTLNPTIAGKIKKYCKTQNLPIIGEIPFDQMLTDAVVNAKTIQEFSPLHPLVTTFHQIWLKGKSIIVEEPKKEKNNENRNLS